MILGTNLFDFFTTYLLLLVIFNKYTAKHIDLFFLTIITLFMGIFISYYHPKYYHFVFNNHEYNMSGYRRWIVDAIHIALFIYTSLYVANTTNQYTITNSILILIVYLFLFDIEKVYRVNKQDLIVIGLIIIILYIIWH